MMITIFATLVGATLYRWRGMSHPLKKYFPRPYNQIAFALPYAMFCPSWYTAIPVLILTTLALLTGHGNFFLRGTGGKDETTEFLIKWLKPYMPLYWYRALGLAMTGILVTLPAGFVLANPLLAISGALKGAAYVISDKAGHDTEGGEWLTGAFLWGALALLT